MDAMSPFEVASGCDVVEIGRQYPNLVHPRRHRQARFGDRPKAIDAMVDRIFPIMRKRGGYIPCCDHGVPAEVSYPITSTTEDAVWNLASNRREIRQPTGFYLRPSMSSQNSGTFCSISSSAMGSLVRKRKSLRVFLCRTRWMSRPASVRSK